jgi:ribulose-phosphate 3-epimerase
MRQIAISPSILSANFARLGDEVLAAQKAGANRIHIDVIDGHFAPNITMGPVVVEAIRPLTELPFDVHLMITDPDRYLEVFAKAGANLIIAHIEAAPSIQTTVESIHDLGCKAGVAISPDTPIDSLSAIAPEVELILVMSVYPGFSGQSFLEDAVDRIRGVRAMLDKAGSNAMVCVDGGVDTSNIGRVVKAGADNIVAATAVFRAGMPIDDAIKHLRRAAGV